MWCQEISSLLCQKFYQMRFQLPQRRAINSHPTVVEIYKSYTLKSSFFLRVAIILSVVFLHKYAAPYSLRRNAGSCDLFWVAPFKVVASVKLIQSRDLGVLGSAGLEQFVLRTASAGKVTVGRSNRVVSKVYIIMSTILDRTLSFISFAEYTSGYILLQIVK